MEHIWAVCSVWYFFQQKPNFLKIVFEQIKPFKKPLTNIQTFYAEGS